MVEEESAVLVEQAEEVDSLLAVELTEADIPGAALQEPLESPTMPELRWWLLCHGICASTT